MRADFVGDQGDTKQRRRRKPVQTLKRRADFLRLRGGRRWACAAFVLEGKAQTSPNDADATGGDAGSRAYAASIAARSGKPRVGYTVTKRLGKAVLRNRIKRRLRATVAALEVGDLRPGFDYVLIARPGALKRAFDDLQRDLRSGLAHIHRQKRHNQAGKR